MRRPGCTARLLECLGATCHAFRLHFRGAIRRSGRGDATDAGVRRRLAAQQLQDAADPGRDHRDLRPHLLLWQAGRRESDHRRKRTRRLQRRGGRSADGPAGGPEMVQMHGGPSRDREAQAMVSRIGERAARRHSTSSSPSRSDQIPTATTSTSRCWPTRNGERLRAARRAGVHHRGAVSRLGNRRATGRRAGPRDGPRHRAARQQADGQAASCSKAWPRPAAWRAAISRARRWPRRSRRSCR